MSLLISTVRRFVIMLFLSFGFLLAHGQMTVSKNWLSDLLEGVNNLTEKIQTDVGRLSQQIRGNVNSQVPPSAYQSIISSALKSAERAGDSLEENNGAIAVKSAGTSRPGASATSINGPLIIVGGGKGARSRVFQAFYAPAGDARTRYVEQEDVVVNGKLHRTQRIYYNGTAGDYHERRYTLDLDDPNAQLQPLDAVAST